MLKLNEINMVECTLGNQKQCSLTVAAFVIWCLGNVLNQMKLIQKLAKRSVSLQTINCGNGDTLTTSEAVDIEIKVQGKTFN